MCFLGYTSSLSRPNRTQVTEGFKRVFIECSFSEQRSHMEVFKFLLDLLDGFGGRFLIILCTFS